MTVDEYINQQTPNHQRILRWLRQLILTSDPYIRETISWNVPVYTCHGIHVCYLNIVRSESRERPEAANTGDSLWSGTPEQYQPIDLAFMRGPELPDQAGLLESRGRKTIKSLVVRAVADPEEDIVRTYLQEALLLNDNRRLQK